MKKILLIITLAFISLHVDAQYYRLRYDSVGIVSKLILNTVTTGSTSDSILVKKANGGVYKISASSLGGGTVTNVSSSNNDIGVTNPSTAPILTLNASSSTGANKVMRRDASGDVAITANLYFQSASNRIQSDTYDMYFKTGTSGTGDFYWKSNSDATQAMKLSYTGDLTVLNGLSVGNTIVGGAGATFVGSVSVADEAYSGSWNGVTTVPTKNAIYDKIESMIGSTTNLALGTPTSTTYPITNSNGTGFTLPSATTSVAGLMSAADKTLVGTISSGTYVPTYTNVANTSSRTNVIAMYTRIGDIVTVDLAVVITPSVLSVQTQVNISLPVGTISGTDVTGVVVAEGTLAVGVVRYGDSGNAELYINNTASTSSQVYHVRFTYSL